MQRRSGFILIIGILGLALASCGGQTSAATTATATVTRGELIQSVSGSGQVKPAQDTSLNFGTSGIVAQVLVKEGQQVQQGATLGDDRHDRSRPAGAPGRGEPEERPGGAQRAQGWPERDRYSHRQGPARSGPDSAEAAAAGQRARQRYRQRARPAARSPGRPGGAEEPWPGRSQRRAAAVSARRRPTSRARATAIRPPRRAPSWILSRSTATLTQAQSRYATASQSWQYVQDTGRDPVNPSKTNAQGKAVPNTLNDAQRQQYYDAFVQAEAALHSAEDGVTTGADRLRQRAPERGRRCAAGRAAAGRCPAPARRAATPNPAEAGRRRGQAGPGPGAAEPAFGRHRQRCGGLTIDG